MTESDFYFCGEWLRPTNAYFKVLKAKIYEKGLPCTGWLTTTGGRIQIQLSPSKEWTHLCHESDVESAPFPYHISLGFILSEDEPKKLRRKQLKAINRLKTFLGNDSFLHLEVKYISNGWCYVLTENNALNLSFVRFLRRLDKGHGKTLTISG